MATEDAESLFSKIKQMSEEGLTSFFSEAMSNERARRALGRAGEKFLANKKTFDRNMETFLDFVNIPSKRDVRELKARLDHLNGQLLNLSIKLDRLLATPKPALKPRGKKGAE
jgi:polyhydroxyalkanoate synthesis regulator phasin